MRYTWDSVRLTSIEGVAAFAYGDNGLLREIRYANGVTEARTYDGRARLTDQQTTGPGGDLLLGRGYQYDHTGNLLAVEDPLVISGLASAEAAYTYDAFGRMTSAHLDRGRDAFDELLTVDYDSIDNITAKTSSRGAESLAHVGAYDYAGAQPRAVTEAGALRLGYDATGYMTRRGDLDLRWDAFGRMTRVERDGEALATHTYGAGMNRLLRETDEGTEWTLTDAFSIRDGIASIHVIDGPRRLARLDSQRLATTVLSDVAPLTEPDGAITAADAWLAHAADRDLIDADLPDADPPAALLNAAVARLLTPEGQHTALHSDLANVVMATDEEGAPVGRAVYYPYGVQRDGEGDLGDYGYNGKAHDEVSNTLYFGARHLDPTLGRWLSPDPTFNVLTSPDLQFPAEELGAYVAMGNNPASFNDGDGRVIGLLSKAVDSVAGAVVGGIVGAGTYGYEDYKQSRIAGADFGEAVFSGLIGGLIGGGVGAAYGAISGLVGSAVDLSISSATSFTGHAAMKGGASAQNQVTTRRVAQTAATFALGAAIGVATVLSGGGALAVAGLVGTTVLAGARLWAIKKAHDSGFSKALYRKYGVNKVTRAIGAPPEQVFSSLELAVVKGPADKPLGGGEATFSVSADGDVVTKRAARSKPKFKRKQSSRFKLSLGKGKK